jgi:hypothetical protein
MMTKYISYVCLLFLMMSLKGCGDADRQLVSSDGPNRPTSSIGSGTFSLAFLPATSARIGSGVSFKIAATTVSGSTSARFTPSDGGTIGVNFDDPSGQPGGNSAGLRVENATFTVHPGALASAENIDMTVLSGTSLDDVLVAFGPAGLQFDPPAELMLVLAGDISSVDLHSLKAYHHTSDGEVTIVNLESYQSNGRLIVRISVPGFSDYSVGGDDPPEGEGP